MAYDSPFSGAYGGAGPALPPGYMEMATQPGRDVQKMLKGIGEQFKERREKKKQEGKELKATRSLAKALKESLGMEDVDIEKADVDTLMGKIQSLAMKQKLREGDQDTATMKMLQQALGAEAEGLATRRDAPFVAQGGPLDEQGEERLRGIQNMLPAIEQNLGAHPEMVETIMELSQGGGRQAGDTFAIPGGGVGMYTSKGGKSAAVVGGIPKPVTELERSRAGYYDAQKIKVEEETKSQRIYHDVMEGFGAGKTNKSGMDSQTKREVTKLESDIQLAKDNLAKIEKLGNDAPFVNYDDGVIDLTKSKKAQGSSWWRNSKAKSDAKLEEEQTLVNLQKQLIKLRGASGGAAIPRPPLYPEEGAGDSLKLFE